jgi:hypothetical protein
MAAGWGRHFALEVPGVELQQPQEVLLMSTVLQQQVGEAALRWWQLLDVPKDQLEGSPQPKCVLRETATLHLMR